MNDLITTISYTDYVKNLRRNGQLSYSTPGLINYFPSQISLTRSAIKDCFNKDQFGLLQELFYGFPSEYRAEFIQEFYNNLTSLVARKFYWPPFSFAESLIKESTNEQLSEHIKLIMKFFRTKKNVLVEIAKKMKDINSEVVQEIYRTADLSLKKRILPYLSSAAVALSEADIELRNRAKKSLGLDTKVVNYNNRIRSALRKVLEEKFPSGKFRKYATCEFEFPHGLMGKSSGKELGTLSFEWKDAYVSKEPNKIKFRLDLMYVSPGYSSGYYYARRGQALALKLTDFDFSEIAEERGSNSFSINKEHWEKLVKWIKTKLETLIRES